MITITLNNFKNVLSEKTYSFDKGELFHLTGSSGAGKSSLLEAFEWVIFGKTTGIKPRAHKNLLPKVELKFEDQTPEGSSWSITREANDLTVKTKSGKTLTSDAAQGYICSIFGEIDLWKCSSYLEQGTRNLLLIGSPEDKFKLLRKLTYGYGTSQEDDPDYHLTIVGEALKKCQKEKATQAAVYDSFYVETEKVLERFNKSENKWESFSSDMEIDELKENIKEYTKEIKVLTIKLNEKNHLLKEKNELAKKLKLNKESKAKLSHSFEVSKYDLEKENINNKINKIKDKVKDLEFSSKIKGFLPYEYDSLEYESLRIKENEYKSWIVKADKLGLNKECLDIDSLKHKLKKLQEYNNWDKFMSLKEKKNYFEEMEVYISDLEKDLEKNNKDKTSLEKRLKKEKLKDTLVFDKKRILQIISDFKKKKCFTCPTCNDSLFLNEKGFLSKSGDVDIKKLESDLKEIEIVLDLYDNLEKLDKENKEIFLDISNTRKELESNFKSFSQDEYDKLKKVVDISKEYEKINIKESDLSDLISSFVSTPDLNKIKLLQNGEYLSKLLGSNFEKFQKYPESFIDDGSDISALEKESKDLKRKLESLESNKETFLKLKTEEDLLNNNLKLVEKKLNNYDQDYEEEIKDLEDKLTEYRNLELDYIRYTEMEQRMTSLNEHRVKLDEINEKLQRIEIIFETIKKISIEPIEILIETINLRLNDYLDKMFIDNPIRVLLSLYKQSSGPKSTSFSKITVNLQVYHGENSYTNINSLSGGESDRVSLALTLALASIVNTPFLFLDECMASLDLELREQCLTLIQETKTRDKIVIDVCHETVEGFHDKIVKIL